MRVPLCSNPGSLGERLGSTVRSGGSFKVEGAGEHGFKSNPEGTGEGTARLQFEFDHSLGTERSNADADFPADATGTDEGYAHVNDSGRGLNLIGFIYNLPQGRLHCLFGATLLGPMPNSAWPRWPTPSRDGCPGGNARLLSNLRRPTISHVPGGSEGAAALATTAPNGGAKREQSSPNYA